MFPIDPPGIPMPIDPVDIPIVVPLESVAVPTQVPVAADDPVPAATPGVVGPAGVDALPPHALRRTPKTRITETCDRRIGGSKSGFGRGNSAVHKIPKPDES
jgi:hypothetical protein